MRDEIDPESRLQEFQFGDDQYYLTGIDHALEDSERSVTNGFVINSIELDPIAGIAHIDITIYPVIRWIDTTITVNFGNNDNEVLEAGPAESSWKNWLKESAHKQKIKESFRE